MTVKPLVFCLLLAHCSIAALADPVLIARYETQQCALPCQPTSIKRIQWWLMREPQQVEIRLCSQNGQPAQHSSVWQKMPGGQYHYTYVLHDARRAIDYTAGDLSVLAMNIDAEFWQLKTQLISDTELAQLKQDPSTPPMQDGVSVEKYSGTLGEGIYTEVWWMPARKLPARVVYLYPQHQVTLQLQALEPMLNTAQANAVLPFSVLATLQPYQHVDFADIGDMEHNPSDRHWLSKALGAPGLTSHPR